MDNSKLEKTSSFSKGVPKSVLSLTNSAVPLHPKERLELLIDMDTEIAHNIIIVPLYTRGLVIDRVCTRVMSEMKTVEDIDFIWEFTRNFFMYKYIETSGKDCKHVDIEELFAKRDVYDMLSDEYLKTHQTNKMFYGAMSNQLDIVLSRRK